MHLPPAVIRGAQELCWAQQWQWLGPTLGLAAVQPRNHTGPGKKVGVEGIPPPHTQVLWWAHSCKV